MLWSFPALHFRFWIIASDRPGIITKKPGPADWRLKLSKLVGSDEHIDVLIVWSKLEALNRVAWMFQNGHKNSWPAHSSALLVGGPRMSWHVGGFWRLPLLSSWAWRDLDLNMIVLHGSSGRWSPFRFKMLAQWPCVQPAAWFVECPRSPGFSSSPLIVAVSRAECPCSTWITWS